MCEWTPPCETSPSRWTRRPRSNAARSAGFSTSEPSSIRLVHAHQILVEPPPGADRQVADLGVAHLAGREPDRLARGLERRVRVRARAVVEHGRLGERDGVAGPGRGAAPAVEDDERYEWDAARQIVANDSTIERRAADERAVDVRLGGELGGVVGLDRAAVEHRHVEDRLDERVRLLRDLGRRGLAGADRPDRLVGDHEVVGVGDTVGDRADLAAQHALGLPRLALRLGLADAGDHVQPVLERGERSACTTVSSVSPKNCRRSEWPTIVP